MNEGKQIEQAIAEGFLRLFNLRFGEDYEVVEPSDVPDVRCRDSKGRGLNLEITLTEDRARDIQAALGRSDHRNLENLNLAPVSSLRGNVLEQAVKRINKKLCRHYGSSAALVVRDASGIDWNWGLVVDDLKTQLDLARNPFDRGVWLLNGSMTEIHRVV